MVSSSSRRSRRNERSTNGRRSRSQSSESSDSSAPTYVVEENSDGELVNKRIGVTWPTRVYHAKRWPDYSSESSLRSSDFDDRQSANSPCEMLSTAEMEAVLAAAADSGSRSSRAEKRVPCVSRSSSVSFSPQNMSLSTEDSSEIEEPTTRIDSVVFDTPEELECYQRLFRNAVAARSSTSTVSVVTPKTRDEREEMDRHYIGVRSRRSVDKKLKPGQFFMYYDKPSGADIPVTIDLKIGYMSSTSKIYHLPIQRFNCDGEQYYAVMQNATDVQMFPSIASLVRHYQTFSHVVPESGRMETFGLPV